MTSTRPWSLSLTLAFLVATSFAQQSTTMSAGSSGGLSTIRVRVSYQQNHRPAPALRVELLSPYGGAADMRST
ncbi:MAG TPA: hypothetical protein VFM77_15340, partial [Terriglobales bacterium]|nr:hypothetical protein [Terriglobales bacterium]